MKLQPVRLSNNFYHKHWSKECLKLDNWHPMSSLSFSWLPMIASVHCKAQHVIKSPQCCLLMVIFRNLKDWPTDDPNQTCQVLTLHVKHSHSHFVCRQFQAILRPDVEQFYLRPVRLKFNPCWKLRLLFSEFLSGKIPGLHIEVTAADFFWMNVIFLSF